MLFKDVAVSLNALRNVFGLMERYHLKITLRFVKAFIDKPQSTKEKLFINVMRMFV